MSDFWWAMLLWMLYIPMLFLWGFTMFDIFRRRDMKAWMKVLWALVILFLPLLGVLIYYIIRPKNLDDWAPVEYDLYAPGPSAYATSYGVPPSSSASVRDLETLTKLHDSGSISDEEYTRLKNQVMAT
jgi:hypothetical protein